VGKPINGSYKEQKKIGECCQKIGKERIKHLNTAVAGKKYQINSSTNHVHLSYGAHQ
jgi:hypothetical protein